ncbi:hypothetical protein [Amycolatopsis sp. CA-230715]|uniref:hypothetical protein n=1 Tax=Amycolatopsis sp. CA-230715 TaxID=2745196 RepID=UPI001C020F65|nr:hypothetical protein [Amycolatopsis sp. CA-230715]QWF77268.1 hypothetical protein HUW46_00658 [Amycolatopsis sp. CA-230715]
MTKTAPLLMRMLMSERIPASAADRDAAVSRITRGREDGALTEREAGDRFDRLDIAATREAVRRALEGLPGVPPAVLVPVRRVVTWVWLGVNVVQIAVWLLMCLIGLHFAPPFWLWSVVGGGLVVAALWLLTESVFRVRG